METLERREWVAMGAEVDGEALGSPSYDVRLLLSVWLYGFMTGLRSSRQLERACREQLPFVWLAGGQQPDHNTLWRFYQQHRATRCWNGCGGTGLRAAINCLLEGGRK